MSRRGKLNSFQRMMLNWEDLHPYNAVHAVRLPRRVPHPALRSCVDSVVRESGLSSVLFDPSRKYFEFSDSAEPPAFECLPAADGSLACLGEEISRQLNRAFPAGRHCPFRFFFMDAPGEAPFLGVTYHHAVGDAYSVALLLRRILDAAFGESSAPPALLDFHSGPLAAAFSSDLSWRRAPALLRGILRDFVRYKRAFVMDYYKHPDESVVFRIGATGLPIQPLREFAAGNRATVQDVVFAALLEGLARMFPEGARGVPWRRNLSLATAINLRGFARPALDNAFGQFLGSYMVMHPVPAGTPFLRLVREVAAQSDFIKRRRLFFSHVWSFTAMAALWPWTGRGVRKRYGGWICPLSGAVSNMNLTDLFDDLGVSTYLRGASTGPIMPLLLDLTTVGSSFSLTTIHRRSAFSEEQVDGLVGRACRRLEEPWKESVS